MRVTLSIELSLPARDRELMIIPCLLLPLAPSSLYVAPHPPLQLDLTTAVFHCVTASPLIPPSSHLRHLFPFNHSFRPRLCHRLCIILDWRRALGPCPRSASDLVYRSASLGLGGRQLCCCAMVVQPLSCRCAEWGSCEEGERQLVLRLHRLATWYWS